jgi:hypothetical protein
MNLRLRFFIQWSRDKSLWECIECQVYSKTKDQKTLTHKPDCWVAKEMADERDIATKYAG